MKATRKRTHKGGMGRGKRAIKIPIRHIFRTTHHRCSERAVHIYVSMYVHACILLDACVHRQRNGLHLDRVCEPQKKLPKSCFEALTEQRRKEE